MSFSLEEVKIIPSSLGLSFLVEGQGIQDIQINIFDLSGRAVFNTGWIEDSFTWNLQNNQGHPLANGVYFYVITVRGFDGKILMSQVKKLIILR